MAAIKWQRTYFGMLATPLRVGDVLAGHLIWIAARVASAVAAYLVVMAAFGATRSIDTAGRPAGRGADRDGLRRPPGRLRRPPGKRGGVSASSSGSGLIPLFLFSGVFFPISQLPAGLRVIAYLSPLWHGVDLCRRLTLGQLTPGPVDHPRRLSGRSDRGRACWPPDLARSDGAGCAREQPSPGASGRPARRRSGSGGAGG